MPAEFARPTECPRPEPVVALRHQGLDALRGALLVAVIIGHFPTSARGSNPFGPLPEWIYFVHIPLFLALSCLFAKPLTGRRLGQRALQLLVPYGLWLALTRPERLSQQPLGWLGDAAMGNYPHVQSILWFLPALFTANALVALWRWSAGANRLWGWAVRLSLALLTGVTLVRAPQLAQLHPQVPFGLDVALFLLPFIAAMTLLWQRRGPLAQALGSWLVPAASLALVLGGVLVQTCEQVKTHSPYARRVDFAQFSVPETLPGYLAMTLMAAALVLLAHRLPAPRWLATLGRCSMPIFLLHYLLLFALTRSIGLAGETRGWLLAYGVLVTALVLGLALLFARLLTRLSPRFAWLGLTVPPN